MNGDYFRVKLQRKLQTKKFSFKNPEKKSANFKCEIKNEKRLMII